MFLYLCEHAAVADSAVGTGGPELRLGVLAEEGSDAGEVGQVLQKSRRGTFLPLHRGNSPHAPWLGDLRFGMLHHPAGAVYS